MPPPESVRTPVRGWSDTVDDDLSIEEGVSSPQPHTNIALPCHSLPPSADSFNISPLINPSLRAIFQLTARSTSNKASKTEAVSMSSPKFTTLLARIDAATLTLPPSWYLQHGTHSFDLAAKTPDTTARTGTAYGHSFSPNHCAKLYDTFSQGYGGLDFPRFGLAWYAIAETIHATAELADYAEFTTRLLAAMTSDDPSAKPSTPTPRPTSREPSSRAVAQSLKPGPPLQSNNRPRSPPQPTTRPTTSHSTTSEAMRAIPSPTHPPPNPPRPPTPNDTLPRSSPKKGHHIPNLPNMSQTMTTTSLLNPTPAPSSSLNMGYGPPNMPSNTIISPSYPPQQHAACILRVIDPRTQPSTGVWPPPQVRLTSAMERNTRSSEGRGVNGFNCLGYDTIGRLRDHPSSSHPSGSHPGNGGKETFNEAVAGPHTVIDGVVDGSVEKPQGSLGTANTKLIVDVMGNHSYVESAQSVDSKSVDTYTFDFGDHNSGARELKRCVRKGAAWNVSRTAKIVAARGYGVKGVVSLKVVNELAAEVARNKIKPVVVREKGIAEKVTMLKFRPGVDGRRNVLSYLEERNKRQEMMASELQEEAYELYQQQHMSYTEEPPKAAHDDTHTVQSVTTSNASVGGGSVAAAAVARKEDLQFGLGHDSIESSLPQTPSVEIAVRKKNRSSSPPQFATMGEGKVLSPQKGAAPSELFKEEEEDHEPKREGTKIWCDHEMCRKKFGRVEEAVFWSQSSNKTFCTYCWELISSHQPHNLVVDYDEKKKEIRAKRAEKKETMREDSIVGEESFVASTSGFYESGLSGRSDGQHNGDMLQTLNSMYNAVGVKKAEFVEEDHSDIELGTKRQVMGTGEYRKIEGVPQGATSIRVAAKDRFGMAQEVSNGVNYMVRRGKNYISDGSLKTPTLHTSAKVKISYMNKETTRGMKGMKTSFSTPVLTAAEAKRRRLLATKKAAKQKRVEEKEGVGRIKARAGATVKTSAGRGKDPLVLTCTSMNASGLKAGGCYAAPDYAVVMGGISKDVAFDAAAAVYDDNLLRGKKTVKERTIKIVHGVPVYFRDADAAMDADEIRRLKTQSRGKSGGGRAEEEGL